MGKHGVALDGLRGRVSEAKRKDMARLLGSCVDRRNTMSHDGTPETEELEQAYQLLQLSRVAVSTTFGALNA